MSTGNVLFSSEQAANAAWDGYTISHRTIQYKSSSTPFILSQARGWRSRKTPGTGSVDMENPSQFEALRRDQEALRYQVFQRGSIWRPHLSAFRDRHTTKHALSATSITPTKPLRRRRNISEGRTFPRPSPKSSSKSCKNWKACWPLIGHTHPRSRRRLRWPFGKNVRQFGPWN